MKNLVRWQWEEEVSIKIHENYKKNYNNEAGEKANNKC